MLAHVNIEDKTLTDIDLQNNELNVKSYTFEGNTHHVNRVITSGWRELIC